MIHDLRRSDRHVFHAAAWLILAIAGGFISDAAFAQTCKWQGGPGGGQCDLQDCGYQGGIALCTEPKPVPPGGAPESKADANGFQYSMCGGGNYTSVDAQWCAAAGGTWNGPTDCRGLPPVVIGGGGTLVIDNDAASSISDAFMNYHAAPCSVLGVSDSGYDANYNDGNCATLQKTTQKIHGGSILLTSGRVRSYPTWAGSQCDISITGIVTISKSRGVKCPQGYSTRTNAAGEMECYIPASCGPSFGNPICAADGAKKQAETDFQSAGIGGLEFARYFNSVGYYHPSAASVGARVYSDYWRHTYDRRIFQADANPYTIASAQRPDGTVEDFDSNGHPLQNYNGAGDVLVAVTSNGQFQGWRLTLADASVEIYSADGKLQTITSREGLATTLAYDAAGRLATVTDQFGRSLALAYDGKGRMQSMTDPAGNLYTYGYDDTGHMVSATYPGNRVRTYVYEDAANPDFITGIVDEEGQRFATFAYDSKGRGVSTQHAGGANLYTFAYGSNSTTVTDPLGTSRSYAFANAKGVLKTASIAQPSTLSGSVTSTTASR